MVYKSQAPPHRHPHNTFPIVVLAALVGAFVTVGVIAATTGFSDDAETEEPTQLTSPPTSTSPIPGVDETATATPSSTTPSFTTSPPPVPEPYQPTPNEVEPDAKRLGALVAHQLTNYDAGASFDTLAAGITDDPYLLASTLASAVPILHAESWSRGEVEYAQLGGLTPDTASIMVVVEQTIGGNGPERVETRTMDIRLRHGAAGTWEFEELASAGGVPVARPDDLRPVAAAVVDDPRIGLPDSAEWDIYAGHTGDSLLTTLAELAEIMPFSAAVLHTGHPYNVFGTGRVSNHSIGRAIDIYEVGGQRVIDGRVEGSVTHDFVTMLAQRDDIYEFGAPWDFPDARSRMFTNLVHQDHIHIGVVANR